MRANTREESPQNRIPLSQTPTIVAPRVLDSPLPRTRRLWLAAIVTLVFVARLALAVRFNLFPDETLYAWQSETMPGSFCPHPPGVLLMVRLGIALLGKTELGVRIFPLLLNTLSVVPMWLLAREVGAAQNAAVAQNVGTSKERGAAQGNDLQNGDSRNKERAETTAFWSVLAMLAAPLYFAFGAITTPDGGQLFFWLCGLLLAWRALNTNQMRWWIAVGAAIGVGLFVKYILILFFPALFLCLLLTPQWRRRLLSPGPYVAVIVALLLFLPPFLRFEYSNDWMTVHYHLGQRQNKQAVNLLDVAVYQGIHAAYLSPLLYIGAIWGAMWALRRGLKGDKGQSNEVKGDCVKGDSAKCDSVKEGRAALVFLFCFAAVPYLFFALIASFTRRDLSREQWDAPSYLTALVAGVLMVQHKVQQVRSLRWRKWGMAAICLGFAMSMCMVIEATGNLFSRILNKPPFLSNLVYTREMAVQVDKRVRDERVRDERVRSASFKPDVLVGGTFTTTLAYAFYGREVRRYYTIGQKFNARYGLVGVLRSIEIEPDFAQREGGRNVLLIIERPGDPVKARLWRQQQMRDLRAAFTSVQEEAPLEIRYRNRFVTRFYLWQCRGLKKIPAGWLVDLSK